MKRRTKNVYPLSLIDFICKEFFINKWKNENKLLTYSKICEILKLINQLRILFDFCIFFYFYI